MFDGWGLIWSGTIWANTNQLDTNSTADHLVAQDRSHCWEDFDSRPLLVWPLILLMVDGWWSPTDSTPDHLVAQDRSHCWEVRHRARITHPGNPPSLCLTHWTWCVPISICICVCICKGRSKETVTYNISLTDLKKRKMAKLNDFWHTLIGRFWYLYASKDSG